VIQLLVDGTVRAETRNLYGNACVPFAAILEDLCDAEAIESDYTADYSAVHHQDTIARVDDHDNA
jgi:hypothetical protein